MLKGNQEPTSCVYLSNADDLKRSKGNEARDYYNESDNKLIEWQELLLSQMMAQDKDGFWVHATFGYTVPRRNGKSESIIARIRWGLENGENILYTAHRNDTSHDFFNRIERYLDECGFIKSSTISKKDDINQALIYDSIKAIGMESIVLRKTKAKIDFRTRTAKGGLGKAYALVIIDEAQEYTSEMESSLRYVVTDYYNPQFIMCGTPPTLVSTGDVFKKYREDTLNYSNENAGWAEWAVDEVTDPKDTEAWARTNPSLGYILSERNIKREITSDDDIDFQIQRLGLWYTYSHKSAIPADVWDASLVQFNRENLVGKLYVGIKFAKSGENTALSIACKTTNNKVFVQSLFCKPTTQGVGWIIETLSRLDYTEVWADGKGGQEMLEKAMKEAKLKHLKLPRVHEVINANAEFEQAVFNNQLEHTPQAALDRVATNCKKRNIGTNGGFGYESNIDTYEVAILDSIIYAYWACKNGKDRKPVKASY